MLSQRAVFHLILQRNKTPLWRSGFRCRKATEQGNAIAQFNLGPMYYEGHAEASSTTNGNPAARMQVMQLRDVNGRVVKFVWVPEDRLARSVSNGLS